MPFNGEGSVSLLEISHTRLPNTDYVVFILDIWKGDRNDPAVQVEQYLAMFDLEHLPDELLVRERYGSFELQRSQQNTAVVWEHVKVIKEKDRDSERYKHESDRLLDPEIYAYGTDRQVKTLYAAFIEAVDRLAVNDNDEEAWAAVDAYRNHRAHMHEK